MDKKWVEEKNAFAKKQHEDRRSRIYGELKTAEYLTDENRSKLLALFDKADYKQLYTEFLLAVAPKGESEYPILTSMERLASGLEKQENYDNLMDQSVEFDGDIIIIDPSNLLTGQDYTQSHHGRNMEEIGFTNYITRENLYGDYTCKVYKTTDEKKRKVGSFSSDTGLFSVLLLSEVLKYNPDFEYKNNKDLTHIKDFKGVVSIVAAPKTGDYFSLNITGKGINKVTGEPISFEATCP